jgi:phenylacetate-CoA ligase
VVELAITRFLAALDETQYLPPERMEAYQRRLLDRLLRHARSQTTFYADRLSPVFRPDDTIDWDRWTEIPILTRIEAQANEDALVARSTPEAAGPSKPDATSGSTGRPLRLAVSQIQSAASACANERYLRWHKIDPRALSAFIVFVDPGEAPYPEGGYTSSSRLVDGDSPGATLNIDTPVFQQVEWLRRTKPATLTTFPTNLREIGRIAAEQGEPLSLDAIVSYGEALTPELRAAIRTYFGKDPIDNYGSTEIGHIAATCPHSGNLHVAADLVKVEIVDDHGRPAVPGSLGRVVATSFYNYATPFIRYDCGDLGIAAAEPCGCARTLPLLECIVGRSRNIFRFADGTTALPRLESPYVQPFVPHRQFQVVQTAFDRIEYRYVPMAPHQPNDLAGLTALVRERLHPSLTVEAVAVAEIPRSPSGKYEDYVCLIGEVDQP